jgi:sugar transferase (PEP-CTERM/EpsH1 system associated)
VTLSAPPLIVHVVYSFTVGGLENGVVNLLNRLPRDRWRHAVIALSTVSADFASRLDRPVELIELNKGPGHLTRHYARLHTLLRSLQPAIVHTRNLAALEAQVPAATAGVPARIHSEHGWDANDPAGNRRRYQLVRRFYRPFVHHYVALSKHLEDYLLQRVGVPRRALSQLYNGVDTKRFRPSSSGRDPIAGSPFTDSGLWLIGTVGRLDAVKDQVNLARAFVHAVEQDAEARRRMRLVIAGDGALRGQIEAVLAEGRVTHLAWLAGERNDVPAVLRGLDCFVLPSLGEGVSNTILEAMASGLPVVATCVGGNAELVANGSTGQIVPAANSAALGEAILRYFRDPASSHKHGAAGRRRVETHFSLDGMVADYDRLYRRMLRPDGRSARSVERPETIGR